MNIFMYEEYNKILIGPGHSPTGALLQSHSERATMAVAVGDVVHASVEHRVHLPRHLLPSKLPREEKYLIDLLID